MAINFLNTVDFNKNQLNNASIQNLGTDPIIGVLGQLIFNTTSNTLKTCTTASSTGPTVNAVFSNSGAGVTSVATTDGTFINLTPDAAASGAVTITADLSAADAVPSAGARFLTKDNKWRVPDFPSSSDTTYDITTAPTGTAIRLTGSDATNDDVKLTGTTNQTQVTRVDGTELRVKLTDDVSIVDDLTVGGKIAQSQTGETNTFASEVSLSSQKLKVLVLVLLELME